MTGFCENSEGVWVSSTVIMLVKLWKIDSMQAEGVIDKLISPFHLRCVNESSLSCIWMLVIGIRFSDQFIVDIIMAK